MKRTKIQRWISLVRKLRTVRCQRDRGTLVMGICDWRRDSTAVVSFLNAHALNLAWKSNALTDSLLDSRYLLRDGVGVRCLLYMLHIDAGVNMNGTELIPEILERLPKDMHIMLAGTRQEVVIRAGMRLRTEGGFGDVTVIDGFQSIDSYIRQCEQARPDVVLLGMGMPKQELLAAEICRSIDYPMLVINGGAILDRLSGHIDSCPFLIKKLNLEWLWRFCNEPTRLFGRVVVGGPLFLVRSLYAMHKGSSVRSRVGP